MGVLQVPRRSMHRSGGADYASQHASGESRDHRLAEAAHRALDVLMVEIAEAHLAQEMADAGIAQLGNLLGDVACRADQRAGAQREADALLLGMARVDPGVQHRRVYLEVGWVQLMARVMHVAARQDKGGG